MIMENLLLHLSVPIPDIKISILDELEMCAPPDGCDQNQEWWRIYNREYFLRCPKIANFCVRSDGKVEISPNLDASIEDIQNRVITSVYGALIHILGQLPIHAAGLVAPNQQGAVLICGHSGSGKSTVSTILAKQGWALLADDVCRITDENNVDKSASIVWPGYTNIKLLPDVCDKTGISKDTLKFIDSEHTKYFWEPPVTCCNAQSVRQIIILNRTGHVGKLSIKRMRGAQSFFQGIEHTYRRGFSGFLGKKMDHFRLLCQVLQNTQMYQVSIPLNVSPSTVAETIVSLNGQNVSVQ